MKTKKNLLIFSMILSITLFSQDIKQTKEIYFEGTVVEEYLGDGFFYITVKFTKGDLIDKTERLYFNGGWDDIYKIECKGYACFDGAGYSKNKIKGKVIESTIENEYYETEDDKRIKCYRPVELNWM